MLPSIEQVKIEQASWSKSVDIYLCIIISTLILVVS